MAFGLHDNRVRRDTELATTFAVTKAADADCRFDRLPCFRADRLGWPWLFPRSLNAHRASLPLFEFCNKPGIAALPSRGGTTQVALGPAEDDCVTLGNKLVVTFRCGSARGGAARSHACGANTPGNGLDERIPSMTCAPWRHPLVSNVSASPYLTLQGCCCGPPPGASDLQGRDSPQQASALEALVAGSALPA